MVICSKHQCGTIKKHRIVIPKAVSLFKGHQTSIWGVRGEEVVMFLFGEKTHP